MQQNIFSHTFYIHKTKGVIVLKKFLKIISVILIIAILTSLFASCKSQPKMLNFSSITEQDLFKLNKREVSIYGYFTLNEPLNNIGYISSQPYQGLYVAQSEDNAKDEITFYQLVFEKDKMIAVAFNKTPEYKTTPVKITGTLEAGPFTDNNSFIYNFRIKDAVIEKVDIHEFSPELQTFYNLAELGLTDILYTKLMEIEEFLASTDEEKEFPSFEEYAEIQEGFKDVSANYVEKNFLDLADKINAVYQKHSKAYANKTFKEEDLVTDLNDLYEAFNVFIFLYASVEISNENVEETS